MAVVNYYVSPTGSDSNAGTLASPWQTIQHALDNSWGGQTYNIYLRAGTYSGEWWIGTPDTHIIAYSGETVTLDGGTTYPTSDNSSILGFDADNCSAEGLIIKNSGMHGLYTFCAGVVFSGKNGRIAYCEVFNTWHQGVQISGDGGVAEFNIVHDTNQSNNRDAGRTVGWGSGLACSRGGISPAIPGITSNAVLRSNVVYNNWGEGLSCFEAYGCLIEDNIIYDNYAVNHYLSDAVNCTSQRNLVYRTAAPAITVLSGGENIALSDEVASVPRSSGNVVINNLMYGGHFSCFAWVVVAGTSGLVNATIANNTVINGNLSVTSGSWTDSFGSHTVSHSGTLIANNIVTGTTSYVNTASGLTFRNNYWAVRPSNAVGTGDITTDPNVLQSGPTTAGSLTRAFFGLPAGSSAIDAGYAVPAVTVDGSGVARNGTLDIGASEYSVAAISWLQLEIPAPLAGQGAVLAAVLICQATAAASALQTGIRAAASVTCSCSASASLSSGAALAGVASANSSATAGLMAGVGLGSAAIVSCAASASLSTSIRLQGAGLSSVSAAAPITTLIRAAGGFIAAASASGSLVTNIRLAGSAVASSSASATGMSLGSASLQGNLTVSSLSTAVLSTSIRVASAAQATSTSAGELVTAIKLSATSICAASVTGTISATSAVLSASASNSVTALASLSTKVQFSAAVATNSVAIATVTTAIKIAGTSVSSASASGGVSTAVTLSALATSRCSTAPAQLQTNLSLAGTSSCSPSSAAGLLTQIEIIGGATSSASCSAHLSVMSSHHAYKKGVFFKIACEGPQFKVEYDRGTVKVKHNATQIKVERIDPDSMIKG